MDSVSNDGIDSRWESGLTTYSCLMIPQDTPIRSHFTTLLYASITILHEILTHAAVSYGFEGIEGDGYDVPLAALRIMSKLTIINSMINVDEELRQWRSINMLCVDMINAQKDTNRSEQVLDMLVDETILYSHKHLEKVNHLFLVAELIALSCAPEFVTATVLPICDR